jgi:hypothetical protein
VEINNTQKFREMLMKDKNRNKFIEPDETDNFLLFLGFVNYNKFGFSSLGTSRVESMKIVHEQLQRDLNIGDWMHDK